MTDMRQMSFSLRSQQGRETMGIELGNVSQTLMKDRAAISAGWRLPIAANP